MGKTEQEKQAAVAQQRLLSFDCGIESAVQAMGMDKEAVVKAAGARDFREFTEWTLNYAGALAKQAEEQAAKAPVPAGTPKP